MFDSLNSLVFLRKNGNPENFEEFEGRDDVESKAILEFKTFTDSLMFKQQRIMFFYSDPQKDIPLEDTTIESFFQIDMNSVKLPGVMLVKPKEEKVVFFDPISEMTADELAVFIFDYVFSDLDTT